MDLLRHLRYFVAVAEELHFGRAARRLHMSQPPLSQRIAGLEKELGVQLFARSSRRVALTPAGETLLGEARALLAAADGLRATMDELRDGHAGALRVAVPPGTAAPVLAAVVAEFGRRRPAVDLQLREAPTTEQLAALRAGRLDAALVRRPAPLADLERGPSFAAPLGVLVPADSPLAAGAAVELAALRGYDLVTAPRADAPERHDEVLSTCHALGFVPGRVHEATDPEFMYGLVLAGRAVALAEPGATPRDGVAWRPLAGEPLHVALTPAWRAGGPRGAVDAFAGAVASALGDAEGWAPRGERVPGPPVPRPAWAS